MTDFFFQMGLSNACFSLALAIVAMVVGAKTKRPHLAYMLWLLVFVKLLTPPIVTIPVGMFSMQPDHVVVTNDHDFNVDEQPVLAETAQASSLSSHVGIIANRAKPWLASIWLLGSVVVFAFSIVRVCRFGRLLAAESEVAPQELQTAAAKMARRLGLNTIPTICTTSSRLSPMVWWTGGRVRIVIPTTLLDQMDAQQSQWILAHELAHVRRRDYLVRWLEWLACVCFWWNPVVWWAQRNLRAMEEICCDALVLSSMQPKPRSYANSILTAVESLACPALRPPAVASEINSGGFLERRFKMIVSETPKRPNTRWLQACVLLCAVVVLPLGIASAQDYKAVERRLGEAVSKGELSLEQAGVMMDALRKAGGAKKEAAKSKSDTDLEGTWKKLQAMVKKGELTKEQAAAKMSAIKKEAAKKDPGSDRAKAYLMKVKKELGVAVEAGRISKEDAAKRYEGAEKGIKERMAAAKTSAIKKEAGKKGQDSDRTKAYLMKVKEQLGAAVEAGRISKEDAAERYDAAEKAIKERIAAGRRGPARRITREDYARSEAELRKAVAEGRISAEDARARLQGLRKIVGERSQGEPTTREDMGTAYERFERRIMAAVEAGKVTREEAREKLDGYRRRMAVAERGEKGITIDEYRRAEEKMRKMIDEGKAKPEDVERRLIEMRKMIAE